MYLCNRAFLGSLSGPRVGSGDFEKPADRVGSDQEVIEMSWVRSGRVRLPCSDPTPEKGPGR